jgi:hypothetical protein
MPYPVYPVQNQTAQQLANIGSNLGVAMFGDANSMMRRSQLEQDLKYKQQQLGLQREELGLKRSLNDSQIALHNAQAQGYTQKNQGSSELADVISQSSIVNQDGTITFDPQRLGQIGGAYAKANPNGDVAKTLSSLAAMSIQQQPGGASEDQYRQAAALQQKLPGENTAFTTGQASKLAKPMMVPQNTQGIIAPSGSMYEQPVKDYAAALDASGNPASVLPDGTPNPVYTPNYVPPAAPAGLPPSDPNGLIPPASLAPATPTAAPSVADAFSAPVQAQRPRTVGNAVVLPQSQKSQQWGTASSRAKSADKYGEAADLAGSVAAKANGLIESSSQLPVAGGGIPVAEQVSKFMIARDSKQAGRADLINQFQSILTGDWLNKSTVLKGAITEREGAELRKDQPSLGASPEAIKMWLEKVGYLSQMDAEFNQLNLKRIEAGMPPIGSLEFKFAYASKVPAPKNLKLYYSSSAKSGETQQGIQPQTAQPATSKAPAVGTVVDGYRFTGGNPADQTSWQPVQ